MQFSLVLFKLSKEGTWYRLIILTRAWVVHELLFDEKVGDASFFCA